VISNLIIFSGALRTYRKPLVALFASIQKSGQQEQVEPLFTERERRRYRKLTQHGELPFEQPTGATDYRISVEVWRALGLNCALALAVLQDIREKARAATKPMQVHGTDFQIRYWENGEMRYAPYWNADTTTEVLKKLEAAGLIWRVHEIPVDGHMVPVRRGLKINDVVDFPLDDDGEFQHVEVYLKAKPFLPPDENPAPLEHGGTLNVPHDALEGFRDAWESVEMKELNRQMGVPEEWKPPF
jgi:hypothetical protein